MDKVTAEVLLEELPPYRDEWVKVKDKQKVKDIIKHIQTVHKKYAGYYDRIALFFDDKDLDKICDSLFEFCKKNIKYKEESEDTQTTGLPTGILFRGEGDCKHYASFCGGILDALKRQGKKISWCYRFVSYNALEPTPHHVFVVVRDGADELWIDPTPGAERAQPVWQIDKTVNCSNMALYENIGNIGVLNHSLMQQVTPTTNDAILGQFAGTFTPYLGLSHYKTGALLTNWNELAADINDMIAKGPHPGHQVSADFVKWIFQNNMQFWNFYWPGGVEPGFDADAILSEYYPRPVFSLDGRLTLDKMQPLDDMEPGMQILTAWIQSLINEYDSAPHPIKTEQVKGFSQGKYGGTEKMNMLNEVRGDSIFKDIGKALEKAVNFIKDGVLKIIGSIPRNAYLGLIGLNVFGWATKLDKKIQQGQWDQIAKAWKKVGGNPSKLRNTIEHGKTKKEVLGVVDQYGNVFPRNYGETIGVEPVTASATTAAWLAAAAPIIAVMMKFIDKDGKMTEVASAVKNALQSKFPQLSLELGDNYEFLDRNTGKEIDFTVDMQDDENFGGGNDDLPDSGSGFDLMQFVRDNPLPVAAAAGLGSSLIINKKGRKANFVLPILIGGGVYFLITTLMQSGSTQKDKKAQILQWVAANGEDGVLEFYTSVLNQMTSAEVDIMYRWLFDYVIPGKQMDTNSNIYKQVMALDAKYHIVGS